MFLVNINAGQLESNGCALVCFDIMITKHGSYNTATANAATAIPFIKTPVPKPL